MGNCTVVIKKKSPLAPAGRAVVVDITLSSSYATGGDTVPIASLFGSSSPKNRLTSLMLQSGAVSPGGHALEATNGATEYAAPLLRVRDAATGAERATASNNATQSDRPIAH